MGCNTSKESVPAAEGQDKEKQENGDVNNKAEGNNVANSEEKSSSAKTITLRGSTPNSPAPQEKDDKNQPEEEAAATKIQAAFRGHKTRKSMKQPEKSSAGETAEPSKQELENEFRPDDQELCQAATKIQASFRGHMTRKQIDKGGENAADGSAPSKKANNEEELDVDLSDPELNKAAVKIQASFRGHMTRKEVEGIHSTQNAH